MTRKIYVKWEAQFVTEMEVPERATEEEIYDLACDIDVPEDEKTKYEDATFNLRSIDFEP